MTDHDRRLDEAEKAIGAVFSDLSVAPQEMIEALKDRIGQCTINMEAIQQDDSGHRTP